ncbi:MAG: zf-HC2 domain-containing protein [Acidobacteriota bacterium]|nr:zf-HC2 domain-containing protein [Acidobacteriota bacterium]
MSGCGRAREIIHEMLDGPLPADRLAELEQHFEGCDACRAFRDELALVQRGLRELPEVPMPDDALEEVWERTVRADDKVVPLATPTKRWAMLASAAVLALVAVLAVFNLWNGVDEPSPEEVEIARAQLEQVLSLTGGALQKTQSATVDRVFRREVSPVLQRISILNLTGSESKTQERRK